MGYRQKQTWVFYTETEDGTETIVGERSVKYPDKCKLYQKIKTTGFTNGVYRYGYRIKGQ